MAKWRRTPRDDSRLEDPPASAAEPGSVARAVDEGLLIARFAVAMEVKNRIIVGALRHDETFSVQAVAAAVRDELGRLAREQAQYTEMVQESRTKAARARGIVRHEHDYHPDDLGALELRRAVYSALSTELDRLRDDEAFVTALVETARADAWGELGGEVEFRLERLAEFPTVDPEYLRTKDQRVKLLLDVDLAGLRARMDEV